MALPVGVLAAIYVNEFAEQRVARGIKLFLDVLNGMPSIVIGIFLYVLLVVGRGQNGFIGALSLAIIMLPLISRSTQEVLALVPNHLREGSLALGVSKWRTILGVILPTTFSGILTGATLAVARAAGETAPLLFTCALFGDWVSGNVSAPLASIPVIIFEYSEAPDPHLNDQAWAAAFVLITFVLIISLLSRSRARPQPAQARARLRRSAFTTFSPQLHRPGSHAPSRRRDHWRGVGSNEASGEREE